MSDEKPPAPAAPVLVAEDSGLLAALLKDAFQAHGVGDDVRVFKDGHSFVAGVAEALARQRRPRLLVIDIQLPGMDGLAAGREVRAMEASAGAPPVPIVFFSSREEDETITAAVVDCFPARFVRKEDQSGPATVALVGARLIRDLLEGAGR